MNDSALLNGVLQTAARLESDLGGFTSAASWRDYLRLPGDALPPADPDQRVRLKLASIAETLKRFESAGVNPEYRQITALPSYGAMQDALREVVRRYGGNDAAMARAATPNAQPGLRTPLAQQMPSSPVARSYSTAKPATDEELPPPAPPSSIREPSLFAPQNAPPEHSILRK